MSSRKSKMIFDIAIIGGGPIGIAFACKLADSNINVVIIEKQTKKKLENPKIDGREVALTHHSADILKKIDEDKFSMFITFNNLYRGASLNSLEIAEEIIKLK